MARPLDPYPIIIYNYQGIYLISMFLLQKHQLQNMAPYGATASITPPPSPYYVLGSSSEDEYQCVIGALNKLNL